MWFWRVHIAVCSVIVIASALWVVMDFGGPYHGTWAEVRTAAIVVSSLYWVYLGVLRVVTSDAFESFTNRPKRGPLPTLHRNRH